MPLPCGVLVSESTTLTPNTGLGCHHTSGTCVVRANSTTLLWIAPSTCWHMAAAHSFGQQDVLVQALALGQVARRMKSVTNSLRAMTLSCWHMTLAHLAVHQYQQLRRMKVGKRVE